MFKGEVVGIEGYRQKELDYAWGILRSLGFRKEDLINFRNKTILDIGCGSAILAKVAKEQEWDEKNNIHITSIDVDLSTYGIQPNDVDIFEMDARDLKFADNSFDLIVSHRAVPTIWGRFLQEKEPIYNNTDDGEESALYSTSWYTKERDLKSVEDDVQKLLNGVLRVLKIGGEFRMVPFIAPPYDNVQGGARIYQIIDKYLKKLQKQGEIEIEYKKRDNIPSGDEKEPQDIAIMRKIKG